MFSTVTPALKLVVVSTISLVDHAGVKAVRMASRFDLRERSPKSSKSMKRMKFPYDAALKH